jgi:structural maintenance of chromosome 4
MEAKCAAKSLELDQERTKMENIRSELAELKETHARDKHEYEVVVKEMDKCKADFQLFERKDVKLREDLKHEKQALKSAQDALEKVKPVRTFSDSYRSLTNRYKKTASFFF